MIGIIYISYFEAGSAAGMLVIADTFVIIVETSPVKCKLLMSNTFFKLIICWIQCLLYSCHCMTS
jgi:hypothetical protein